MVATLRDLAAAGLLPDELKEKMKRRARGQRLPGNTSRPGRPNVLTKLRGNLALARVALLGR